MGSLEDLTFRGGVTKNQYIGGGLPKNMGGGGLDSLLIQGGLGKKEGGGVLRGEVDTPMSTMCDLFFIFIFIFIMINRLIS